MAGCQGNDISVQTGTATFASRQRVWPPLILTRSPRLRLRVIGRLFLQSPALPQMLFLFPHSHRTVTISGGAIQLGKAAVSSDW